MKDSFYTELLETLKKDSEFVSDEGSLLKNKIIEKANKLDEEFLKLLMSNEIVKKRLFKKIENAYIFDKVEFGWFINNREFLPDSYTKFKNNIGLTDSNDNFIKNKKDVVLTFPFKDCILVGGQDDKESKREEKFYNQTLAPEEVNTLLSPKVLTNFKKYGDGEIDFSKKENLIIKGNNLLTISSLLKKYEGKIKLIYIDPPYNTESDTFLYNDKFNRSTWLTFLKNRLEVAKRLLRPDGAIYVQLDYNEVHYAKVLMDEIFGEENFQREIIWRIGWVSGYKTKANNYIRNHDTILFYSKDNKQMDFNKYYIMNEDFSKRIKESDLNKKLSEYNLSKKDKKSICKFVNHDSRPPKYPLEDVWNCNEYDELNSIAIMSFAGETVSKMLDSKELELKGQKSEALIKRIIEAHTQEGDYVLDFFGGTGTTASVAHKMNRNYILCEQMDYIKTITLERMKKVIEGDTSGISKKVNWTGGGSFVYCELKNLNNAFIEKINGSNETDELWNMFVELKNSPYVNYRIDINRFNDMKDEFYSLNIEEQKELLVGILDKNMLYVNYSDLDDKDYNLSDEEKEFNKNFYEGE